MKPHSKKRLIMAAIIRWWSVFKEGDTFRSEDIIKGVKREMGLKYIYPDTILRYCRLLRDQGKINYICTHKADRIIKVLK
jgi:hypothetical protein